MELERLTYEGGSTTDLSKILASNTLPSPALAEVMKQWLEEVDSRRWSEPPTGTLPRDEALDFESDTIVLVRKLGEGGMGVVYEGFDKLLGRAVAVKFLSAKSNQDTSARKRLLSEAQAAAQVHHENIVAIYSIHPHGNIP